MSNNTNNSCGVCPPVIPVTPIAPPPACNTPACEEYISSNCVSNEVDAGCQSVFENPITGDITPVGYNISSGDSLTTVISALTDPKNCLFTENYLGAALQYIGNSSLLTNILCNIIQDCIEGCLLQVVTRLSFDPIKLDTTGATQDAYWTTNFIPHLDSTNKPDYEYVITITDTTASVPTVYQITLSPAQQLALYNSVTQVVEFDFNVSGYNLTQIVGPSVGSKFDVLPSGHTYEVEFKSKFQGLECDSDSFTLVVPQSPECPDCEYIISIETAPIEDTPEGCIYINISSESPAGVPNEPFAYAIEVFNNTTQTSVQSTPFYVVTGDPTPPCGYTFCLCDLIGTDYTIKVTAVCSFDPLYCTGSSESIDVTNVPPSACAAPDITNITVS